MTVRTIGHVPSHVIPHTRTARRIEHAQQTQLIRARILDAVHLTFRQIDARAGCDLCVSDAGPHAALAFQDEEHFFILVKMIGRAAGRDRANKLRRLCAANFIVNQHAIPAIGSGLCRTIGEAYNWRFIWSGRTG